MTTAHRGGNRDKNAVVPPAEFRSYYGRPIVRPAPWKPDIPAYFFLGGVAAGCSALAAGADLTGRPGLRRRARWAALAAIGGGTFALIHDLGRPERFHHMLRVAKPTSPMSVGTWILTAYGPAAGLAAVAGELDRRSLPRPLRWVGRLARPAGLWAAALSPALATYTAVLLGDTATPAWQASRRSLPLLFAAGAAASAGGVGLLGPLAESGPARRLAVAGAVAELVASESLEREARGAAGDAFATGRAARLRTGAQWAMAGGAALAVAGRRSRLLSGLAGVSLLAGSALARFAVFEAGQASARDPKYTVVPQRERLGG